MRGVNMSRNMYNNEIGSCTKDDEMIDIVSMYNEVIDNTLKEV